MTQREQRKDDHIRLALNHPEQLSDFNHIQLIHHSIPSVNQTDINLQTMISNLPLEFPLYINAMTGGSKWAGEINQKLAVISRETNIAMAVGSMHAALKNSALIPTYQVIRTINPSGTVFANIGADVPLDFAQRAIEMIDADALQIHLNAPQEVVMPEGGRDFSDWLTNIEAINEKVSVPVIAKEVGFGMSRETLQQLTSIGIEGADISGRGGTNFVYIENERRPQKDQSYLIGWGQTTPVSLLESLPFQRDIDILASGGIQTPLDAIKSLVMGAKAVGLSRAVLKEVELNGVEAAIQFIELFKAHMKDIALILGAKDIIALKQVPYILSPELESWQRQRNERERKR
ncbi:type 2 isopentenyl-diphosphate Delta-isomerase [Macrococcus hajekii]|uniref:Isopentenyl-diphosphate delta-isomerase n=1 Tax=Macrococcus hajekii TaxID=198482 RepID=A0A4R6BK40_9STAP|nr:type 2 isopentenyl-diphosphate Delta-isomerase [Macrococcus hajekii]TDM01931.1 type 2 isopentenyl-diphosphate Delta-isomerase [Macrococcus hajekii]GGB08652.1 isopentenyl-diphosphate delta-isomerase [Macrococcus hajekii]